MGVRLAVDQIGRNGTRSSEPNPRRRKIAQPEVVMPRRNVRLIGYPDPNDGAEPRVLAKTLFPALCARRSDYLNQYTRFTGQG